MLDKDLVIHCSNESEKLIATAFLYALGYIRGKYHTFEIYMKEAHLNYDDYPNVLLRKRQYIPKLYIDAVPANYYTGTHIQFGEMSKIPEWVLALKNETMKISADYDATVTKEGIQVGCQNIKFEDFDKLAEIVAKVRN